MKEKGTLPFGDMAGPMVQDAFAQAKTYAQYVDLLGEKGIQVELLDEQNRAPGVRYRSHDGKAGCSGTAAGVPRKALQGKFRDLRALTQTVTPVPIRQAAARHPATAAAVSRNHNLKSDYEIYKFEHQRDQRARFQEEKTSAWAKEQRIRTRTFAWIRRWKLFRDATIRGFYGRSWRARADKQMMLGLSARLAERARRKAFEKNSARWRQTLDVLKAEIGKPEKPLTYLAWLQAQQPSEKRDAEIIAMRGKVPPAPVQTPQRAQEPIRLPEVPRHPEPAKTAPRPPEPREEALPPAATVSPPVRAPDPVKPTSDERKKPHQDRPSRDLSHVARMVEAYRDGADLEPVMAELVARAEKRNDPKAARETIQLHILFSFSLPIPDGPDGVPPDIETDRDRRIRAVELVIAKGKTANQAIAQIRESDEKLAKDRRGKPSSWGKGRGPKNDPGIGD